MENYYATIKLLFCNIFGMICEVILWEVLYPSALLGTHCGSVLVRGVRMCKKEKKGVKKDSKKNSMGMSTRARERERAR